MNHFNANTDNISTENNGRNDHEPMESGMIQLPTNRIDVSIKDIDNNAAVSIPFTRSTCIYPARHSKSLSMINYNSGLLSTPDSSFEKKMTVLPKPCFSAEFNRRRPRKPPLLIRNNGELIFEMNDSACFDKNNPPEYVKRKISFGSSCNKRDFKILKPLELLRSSENIVFKYLSGESDPSGNIIVQNNELIAPLLEHPKLKMCTMLGNGDSGCAFKCIQDKSDGYFVIKKYNRIIHGKNDFMRIIREAAALSQIQHTNIVKYIESYVEDNKFYLKTEYCNGLNLSLIIEKYLKISHIPAEFKVKNILRQILAGLEHIHSIGIVHYDIKPENIFSQIFSINNDVNIHEINDSYIFDSNDIIYKIGDFGHCYITDVIQAEDIVEGDSRYLAQESLEWPTVNHQNNDIKSFFPSPLADIFALSLTICEYCGSGDLPSCGESWQQIRHGHLPKIGSIYSSQLIDLLTKMIAISSIRPSASQCLMHEYFN